MTAKPRTWLAWSPRRQKYPPKLRRMYMVFALVPACLGFAGPVYQNTFNDPPGTTYPEWTATRDQTPKVVESPNRLRRFLGEFGGPHLVTGPPFARVDQTVRLRLEKLPPHKAITIEFDLCILKSWDGDNPHYGPDRWKLTVAGGPTLLDTTFSNNHKQTDYDRSLQQYPVANSQPQTGATEINMLGYLFFGDAIYHLNFTFPHTGSEVRFDFASSLYEGKGIDDESWGLDNVIVAVQP